MEHLRTGQKLARALRPLGQLIADRVQVSRHRKGWNMKTRAAYVCTHVTHAHVHTCTPTHTHMCMNTFIHTYSNSFFVPPASLDWPTLILLLLGTLNLHLVT